MSTTKMAEFARKYGKKYGGNLCLEGSKSGNQLINHEKLPDLQVPEKIVTLTGYIEFNEAKRRKTGKDGAQVRTGYVTGLAVNGGQLYAITVDSVYRIYGPWYPDVIKNDPFLNSLWEDVKKGVLAQASKKA
ncbi:hypothetical protein [Enterobacter hormaechei]|uniref:hypothetical protein n=1 Tax=Enterobacter hormaechei TaxID=158836 RepID=UPI0030766CFB